MASYKNIFKITHNDVLPIQGSILIAEPFLQDAYFQRSVVLLIEHTEHGSRKTSPFFSVGILLI